MEPTNYLETWGYIAKVAALVLVLMACVNFIIYMILVTVMGNRSGRYSFVLNNETRVMLASAGMIALAVAVLMNIQILNERDFGHTFAFILKSGLSLGIGAIVMVGFSSYLNVYYPFVLEKRLADIRFRERKNPSNGRPMRLLNEEDEDEYLTEDMIQQEKDLSYDFDVWLDDTTGETIIETYKGSPNRICDECQFRTLKLIKEEISEETMLKTKYYLCSHCGHKDRVQEV